jgi:hypothetical protein
MERAQVEGLTLFGGHLRPSLGPSLRCTLEIRSQGQAKSQSPAPHFGPKVPHLLTLPVVKNEAKVFIELINISKSQGIGRGEGSYAHSLRKEGILLPYE